jgi:hypothetical protein
MDNLKALVVGIVRLQVQRIRADLKEIKEDATNAYRWYVDK